MALTTLLLLKDIMSSSSSSSESSESETDDIIMSNAQNPTRLPKITNFYKDVICKYSEEEFKRNFRLNKHTFSWLHQKFLQSPWFPKGKKGGSIPTSSEVMMLSFLWFAGNKSCLRTVAGRFNTSESTLHSNITRVMMFLLELAPSLIKFPNTEEGKKRLADNFKKISGFPNVLGCIHGTYLSIRTPAHKLKSTYVNRHDIPSLTLQAICDSNLLFLNAFTGVSGRVHDARVYKMSFISKKLKWICGNQWHILGDSAYPLKKYLLTPFQHYRQLSDVEKNYNYKFSVTRVKIENSFGLLKSRWRQLLHLDFKTVERASKFILCCCVLHNLCILNKDYFDIATSADVETEEERTIHQEPSLQEKGEGEQKRRRIANILYNV